MAKDIEVDWYVECSGAEGAAGGVGLWQFVVQSGDGSVATYTDHTVCRYGDLYNVAPDCPWNACANGDCSVCRDAWAA